MISLINSFCLLTAREIIRLPKGNIVTTFPHFNLVYDLGYDKDL